MCVQTMKFVALPVPEIIACNQKNWAVPDTSTHNGYFDYINLVRDASLSVRQGSVKIDAVGRVCLIRQIEPHTHIAERPYQHLAGTCARPTVHTVCWREGAEWGDGKWETGLWKG